MTFPGHDGPYVAVLMRKTRRAVAAGRLPLGGTALGHRLHDDEGNGA
jgi:hypothetical protein